MDPSGVFAGTATMRQARRENLIRNRVEEEMTETNRVVIPDRKDLAPFQNHVSENHRVKKVAKRMKEDRSEGNRLVSRVTRAVLIGKEAGRFQNLNSGSLRVIKMEELVKENDLGRSLSEIHASRAALIGKEAGGRFQNLNSGSLRVIKKEELVKEIDLGRNPSESHASRVALSAEEVVDLFQNRHSKNPLTGTGVMNHSERSHLGIPVSKAALSASEAGNHFQNPSGKDRRKKGVSHMDGNRSGLSPATREKRKAMTARASVLSLNHG